MGDLDNLKKDQLISSELDGGQLAEMMSDCQEITDIGKQFSYEGNSKNLEGDPEPSSGRISLKEGHDIEFLDPGNGKKLHQQSQLQAISGAENLHHGTNFGQTSEQVPEFSCESEISTSHYQGGQNPTEDPNCSELIWEYGFGYNPEIREIEQLLEIQSPESNVTCQPQEGDNCVQPQDCFAFGNFSSTTASNLPNVTVTNSVKYITDSSFRQEPDCVLSEAPNTVTSSSHSVSSERQNHPVADESVSHPVEDSTVSDFNDIFLVTNEVTNSLGNIRLHSLKSSETDTVIVAQTEQVCSPSGSAYQDTTYDQELFNFDIGEILHEVSELEDSQEIVEELEFGLEELPSEFPESGSLLIPTTVDEWEVSDDENSPRTARKSKRMKNKAGSQSTNAATSKGASTKQKQRSIWTFLLDSLYDKRCNPSYIKWTDEKLGQFKIVNGPELAKKWSDGRNRQELKYGHFARAMRHYYKKAFLSRVPGKKLMYEFGERSGWRQYKPRSELEFN